MAGYTKLNLKDQIEDQAPKFGMSPDLEFRSARVPLEMENAGVSYLRAGPNYRVPFGHHHNVQEEVYVVVSGSGLRRPRLGRGGRPSTGGRGRAHARARDARDRGGHARGDPHRPPRLEV